MANPTKQREKTQAYPLAWPEGWPRTPKDQQANGFQFKQKSYDNGYPELVPVTLIYAYQLLHEELISLGADNIVVSTNYRTDRYGELNERTLGVKDRGIAVYFLLNGRPVAMACDRYERAAANLRSLGLAVEAMRQLERHGGGAMMERAFSGFVALPPPPSCWDVLGLEAGASSAGIDRAFRERAKKLHPDAGGNDHAMAELNVARDRALQEIAA